MDLTCPTGDSLGVSYSGDTVVVVVVLLCMFTVGVGDERQRFSSI